MIHISSGPYDEQEEITALKLEEVDRRVPGRLKSRADYWKDTLGASSHVLDWVTNGYSLPFVSIPPRSELPNNRSARDPVNAVFIDHQIEELLAAGAIREVQEKPHLVLPLQVVSPEGRKRRLVVDASRSLNVHLSDDKVKLDHLHRICPSLQRGHWFSVLDLKQGYYHVPVRPEHQTFLGCQWKGRYFIWLVTFLGMSSLVRDFSKITRVIVAYCRGRGISVYCYIDDLLVLGRSEAEAVANKIFLETVLENAGFIVNTKKTVGPVQKGIYLGLELDLVNYKIFFPAAKLSKVITKLEELRDSATTTARVLAQTYGLLLSGLLATGPILLLLVRIGFAQIAENDKHWDRYFEISADLKNEVQYLIDNLDGINGSPIVREDDTVSRALTNTQTASDASAVGLAVCRITCQQGKDHESHTGDCGSGWLWRKFTEEEAEMSSTWRELSAIAFLLQEKGHELRRKSVLHWTDSFCTEQILFKGSSKPHLQRLALGIYREAKRQEIDLQVVWRSRGDPRLKLADDHSRSFDLNDVGVSPEDFERLSEVFGPFDVDLFASRDNYRLPKFVSLLAANGCWFRNAFSRDWGTIGNIYAHPPVYLIGEAIRRFVADEAEGILIMPFWRSHKDWSFVANDGVHVNNGIASVQIFNPRYQKGAYVRSPVFDGFPRFSSLVLRFTGKTVSEPFRSKVTRSHCLYKGCKLCWYK